MIDLGPPDRRAAEDVLVAPGGHRVEPNRREDVPGRHLAEVVIAAETIRRGSVHLGHDPPGPFLGLPGLSGVAVEVRYVVTGLVSVDIVADDSGAGDVLVVGDALIVEEVCQ